MYGKSGQDNLICRKVQGRKRIRTLRRRTWQSEFSERKGTALWTCKIDEEQAIHGHFNGRDVGVRALMTGSPIL